MHINSLPADILIAILKPICEEKHFRTSYWLSRMNVLAVCHKWRCLAQRMVYNTVSVDYVHKLRTNLDLMSEKMMHYPRGTNIWVTCDEDDTVGYLQEVLEKLKEHRSKLYKVSSLYMHVRFSATLTNDSTENLQELAKCLKSLLPRVSTLCCHINTTEANGLIFESALVKHYAPRLENAELDSSALNGDVVFTDSLTKLWLSCHPDHIITPKIITNCLTRLELAGIEESFNWDVFSANNCADTDILSFPSLEYMYIDILLEDVNVDNADEDADSNSRLLVGPDNSFDYRLDVPRLRFLEIRLCPFACSFLAALPVPMEIEKLTILACDTTTFEFLGFHMSAAARQVFEKYYAIGVADGYVYDIDFVNDLQSIHGVVQHGACVHIGQDFSIADIENIWWPQVTKFSTDIPISISSVLMLVRSKLPDIVSIEAYSIEVEILEDGTIGIPELQDANVVSPIESKVESLIYGFDTSDDAPEHLCKEFNAFMFSTIDSLKNVSYFK